MNLTDVNVDEMLDSPLFRNTVHLIGTIGTGYLLLRILLYILDVTKIGLRWLESHQDGGFLIMILVFVCSLLATDIGISFGRRRFGEVKYSVVESGISWVRDSIQKSPEVPLRVNDNTGTGIHRTDLLSGVPGLSGGKEPVIQETKIKKPSPISTLNQKHELTPVPVIEPPRYEREKHLSFDDIINELNTGDISEIKPESVPSTVFDSDKEPGSNLKFYESVPIPVREGKRVIKAFDSKHSINVIDFRSKITKKDVTITIELLKDHSVKTFPITEGLVYEFDTIGINIPDEAIDKAVIRFKIDQDWITQNKIQNVQLEMFINGAWDIITIKGIGQDTKYLFYEANVPSLSAAIAIVGI
ncbi:MAG: PGF-pre-PGF domain-containing protein [ANME-2 cluster archaeon]|nr:PGF-pre-PGF domain-containing protein [ANME-2 cluster archaeon]